jgi:hypothetical protein
MQTEFDNHLDTEMMDELMKEAHHELMKKDLTAEDIKKTTPTKPLPEGEVLYLQTDEEEPD